MKTILIVDDSESILEVVKYTLTNEGYEVISGKDGIDALEKLEKKRDRIINIEFRLAVFNLNWYTVAPSLCMK